MRRKARLGKARNKPDNGAMKTIPDDRGFQFPGVFEITAMGATEAALEREIPALLAAAGLSVLHETVRMRASSAGRYVSVSISFRAESRSQYDDAHTALRAHPEVKWTL